MVLSVPKKALGNGPNAHLLVLERVEGRVLGIKSAGRGILVSQIQV